MWMSSERKLPHQIPPAPHLLEVNRRSSNPHDYVYHSQLNRILTKGQVIEGDRTGVGTLFLPDGCQMTFNLAEGFPAVTTKSLYMKGVAVELAWFIDGGTNIKPLVDNNVHIWNEWPLREWLKSTGQLESNPPGSEGWERKMEEFVGLIKQDKQFADIHGELGNVYGKQWVDWKTSDGRQINQLKNAIDTLKTNPFSRRIIVSAWNVEDIPYLAAHSLPPCHALYQFNVGPDRKLHTDMYQRSADFFLGVPFNIASYALLTHLIARETGLTPGTLTISFGNAHLYLNHLEQAREQLSRTSFRPPTLWLDPKLTRVFDFKHEMQGLENYKHHPRIEAKIAV